MKKIRVMALSDLHLGEPEGLLYNNPPNILDIFVDKVSKLAKGGGGIEDGIEELVLIGDIADLSEAKPEDAYANTMDFLKALLKKVNVDKVVYIPGNHDHHLWVEMLESHYGKGYKECTPKTGVSIQRPKALMERCIPTDYKGGVEAYYPFYKVRIDNSIFLFDHGHLFSSFLNKQAGPVSGLEEIEEKTWEFMESIWFQGKKAPLFYRLREMAYDWGRWASLRVSHPTRGVSFKEDSTPVFDDGLRNGIVTYLEKMLKLSIDTDDTHLVFGHTHYGGRVLKDDRKIRVNGRFITLWNTGGWLVPSEVFSPDAFVFYIEQTGSGLRPQACKLVGREGDEEGDYDKAILKEIVKRIG